jgi:hypothetical protein
MLVYYIDVSRKFIYQSNVSNTILIRCEFCYNGYPGVRSGVGKEMRKGEEERKRL